MNSGGGAGCETDDQGFVAWSFQHSPNLVDVPRGKHYDGKGGDHGVKPAEPVTGKRRLAA